MEKKETLIDYWVKSSALDFEAAEDLFISGKYAHALFFGHLSVEKMLKALYINIVEDYPPRTHNLLMLLRKINIDLPDKMLNDLILINTFNIETRYPDEKFQFYELCDKKFTLQNINSIKEVLKWLNRML